MFSKKTSPLVSLESQLVRSCSPRRTKISTAIRKVASEWLRACSQFELNQALLTISSVDVSKDLRHATVWISIFVSDSLNAVSKNVYLEALQVQASPLRLHLSRTLPLRRVPKLIFKLNHDLDAFQHIRDRKSVV